jgi:hypothetical protein
MVIEGAGRERGEVVPEISGREFSERPSKPFLAVTELGVQRAAERSDVQAGLEREAYSSEVISAGAMRG